MTGEGSAHDSLWARAAWDSEFFGFPIARASGGVGSPEDGERLCMDLAEHGIILCYVMSSEAERFEQSSLVKSVYVDDRCLYSKSLNNPAGTASDLGSIEQLTATHATSAQVRQLAVASGAYSRFRLDPGISSEKFEEMYTQWIVGTLRGEGPDSVVFGAQENHGVVGITSIRADDAFATIGLVAVDDASRGRGVGGRLLQAAEHWAVDRGLTEVRVATQAANVAARNLYERSEYALVREDTLLHVWLT